MTDKIKQLPNVGMPTDEQKMLSPLVTVAGRPMTYAEYVGKLFKIMPDFNQSLVHAALGASGETGELADAVKKAWAYGKELDKENVREELGDSLFYLQAMCNLMGFSFSEVLQANADKLQARYGQSYSDAKAINRADKQ